MVLLIISGGIIGGIYGAIYDQITFSISPEFFTKFRFPLYKIDTASERWGAAIVGFLNASKTGLIIGLILSLCGLITKDYKKMFKYTMQAFFITLLLAFLIGMIGYSVSRLDGQRLPDPDLNIQDVVAFRTVENMNNFSYAGGVIGMFIGIFFQVYRHKKMKLKEEGAL